MTEISDNTFIKVSAIFSIMVLEGIALATHTDGAYFGPAIAIIGGIAGYELRGLKQRAEQKATQEG